MGVLVGDLVYRRGQQLSPFTSVVQLLITEADATHVERVNRRWTTAPPSPGLVGLVRESRHVECCSWQGATGHCKHIILGCLLFIIPGVTNRILLSPRHIYRVSKYNNAIDFCWLLPASWSSPIIMQVLVISFYCNPRERVLPNEFGGCVTLVRVAVKFPSRPEGYNPSWHWRRAITSLPAPSPGGQECKKDKIHTFNVGVWVFVGRKCFRKKK